jgi:hypothetical protein
MQQEKQRNTQLPRQIQQSHKLGPNVSGKNKSSISE